MCIPVHVSASYICVHVSLSSVPALWHLGLLFPRGWKLEHPIGGIPTAFSPFHLFFPSCFPITPSFFPLQSMPGAVLPSGVTIPASREKHPASWEKWFSAASRGWTTFRKHSSAEISQKKKIVKEGKHCDILGISQRDAAASLGRGFVGCKVFFIINYH